MEDLQMVINAVSLKAASHSKDSMITVLSNLLLEKLKSLKLDGWEASDRKVKLAVRIYHAESMETLKWDSKPTKKNTSPSTEN